MKRIILKLCCVIIFLICGIKKYKLSEIGNNLNNNNAESIEINKLIQENFFVIDSNNLENIDNHIYGFTISKEGILTDNYYKNLGYYKDPEPQGVYIMIRKNGNIIRIEQDYLGCFGLYIYENKSIGYFALSNSFLLLEEFLIKKQKLSFNKEFADNFIISELCTPSIYETMINEIIKLPSNAIIRINKKTKIINIFYIDYKENTVPFYSKEGIEIIDKWVDKWGYILRSLKKKTRNIYSDLSGGFDTRITLSILLNSNIDLNDILIKSTIDNKHGHDEDYKIAQNISSKYGFKLNKFALDKNYTMWETKDSLQCIIYTKLGFHKEFYQRDRFFDSPRFSFTGVGGEIIRGSPGSKIKDYVHKICSKGRGIKDHDKEFYNSSMRLCNRSLILLSKSKEFGNEYEISSVFYSKGRAINHFGKLALESFLTNVYSLQPLIDPEIKKIKYDISGKSPHDLIAYIYVRFAHDLINFPVQGNREINQDSIKKAEILCDKLLPYKIKTDYNPNFYIDVERNSPFPISNNSLDINEYLEKLIKSSIFIKIINKIYDRNVYDFAVEYSLKSNYYPLRNFYALLAVALTKEFLFLNEEYMKKSNFKNNIKINHFVINNLLRENQI